MTECDSNTLPLLKREQPMKLIRAYMRLFVRI